MASETYFTTSGRQIRRIEYVCASCGATDHLKLFQEEPIEPIIHCWKCKAGRNLKRNEALATGEGMFPSIGDLTPLEVT